MSAWHDDDDGATAKVFLSNFTCLKREQRGRSFSLFRTATLLIFAAAAGSIGAGTLVVVVVVVAATAAAAATVAGLAGLVGNLLLLLLAAVTAVKLRQSIVSRGQSHSSGELVFCLIWISSALSYIALANLPSHSLYLTSPSYALNAQAAAVV